MRGRQDPGHATTAFHHRAALSRLAALLGTQTSRPCLQPHSRWRLHQADKLSVNHRDGWQHACCPPKAKAHTAPFRRYNTDKATSRVQSGLVALAILRHIGCTVQCSAVLCCAAVQCAAAAAQRIFRVLPSVVFQVLMIGRRHSSRAHTTRVPGSPGLYECVRSVVEARTLAVVVAAVAVR